jgi:hypothetical protein
MIEFKPRYFVLPAIALTVLAMLHAPPDGGRSARAGECGQVLHSADASIRASFQHHQSATAAKICAIARNNLP